MKTITIQKGDDTGAFGIRRLRIKIDQSCLSTGMTASFSLLSYTKDFTAAEVATGELDIELSGVVTSTFPLGTYFGALRLFDAASRLLTMTGRIPFTVVPAGSTSRIPGDGVTVQSLTFATDVVTIRVGFAVDYADMDNKPSINGVSVDGDRSASDFGIATSAALATEAGRATAKEGELAVSIESLGTAVASETSRALAAEASLSASDGELSGRITSEVARAKAREDSIEASVSGMVSAVVYSETARARSAEAALAMSVTEERGRALASESALEEAVIDESNRAKGVEAALSTSAATIAGSVEAERARASSAEAVNAAAVVAENERALAAESDIRATISAMGETRYRVVNELPEIGTAGIIYLVPSVKQKTGNVRDEYLWIDGHWELIGSTDIDLSDYVKTNDLRLTDARTPTSHAVSHKSGGADAITLADLDGDSGHRTVTDDEKSSWGAKVSSVNGKDGSGADGAVVLNANDMKFASSDSYPLASIISRNSSENRTTLFKDRFMPLSTEGNMFSFAQLHYDMNYIVNGAGEKVCLVGPDGKVISSFNGVLWKGHTFEEWEAIGDVPSVVMRAEYDSKVDAASETVNVTAYVAHDADDGYVEFGLKQVSATRFEYNDELSTIYLEKDGSVADLCINGDHYSGTIEIYDGSISFPEAGYVLKRLSYTTTLYDTSLAPKAKELTAAHLVSVYQSNGVTTIKASDGNETKIEIVSPDSSDVFSDDGRAASAYGTKQALAKKIELQDSLGSAGFCLVQSGAAVCIIGERGMGTEFFEKKTSSSSTLHPDGSPVLTSKLLTGESGKRTSDEIKTSLFSSDGFSYPSAPAGSLAGKINTIEGQLSGLADALATL